MVRRRLLFYFQAVGIAEDILYGCRGRFKLRFVYIIFRQQQLPVVQLQFPVKGQHTANLLCFLLGGLVVDKPDQVVLGKRFRHRHIGFWSFSSSS